MEALSNALQHSGAATVSLSARHDPQSAAIVITIEDDGRGFDASRVGPGRGLRTMRARGQQAGMQVSMTSSPGGGTRMELRVPVATP
jgi:signal transduction histidine kinase